MTDRPFTHEEKVTLDNFVSGFRAKLVDVEISVGPKTLKKAVVDLADALDDEEFSKKFQTMCEAFDI